jgi:hypothetical protein
MERKFREGCKNQLTPFERKIIHSSHLNFMLKKVSKIDMIQLGNSGWLCGYYIMTLLIDKNVAK